MATINETELEQTFADMAYAHLRDKSNTLLDYLLGFQLLKVEDDGKRAVGIFGFEIDGGIYYAPVFFLNGEIRGLEAIYSLEHDLTSPLTDDMINSLVNKANVNIGERAPGGRRQRGVRDPSYQQLRVVPGGSNVKLGKILEDNPADRVMETLPNDRVDVMPLPESARLMGKEAQLLVLQAMQKSAAVRNAMSTYYDMRDFLPQATAVEEKTAAEGEKDLIIIGGVSDEGVEQLTDQQRKEILAGGVAVMDKRPEVDRNRLYKQETTRQLENPNCPGIYEVLMADGSIRPLLVLTTGLRRSIFNVIDPEDGTSALVRPECVYAVSYRDKGLREWALDAPQPSDVRPGRCYSFTNLEGEGTVAFSVKEKTTGLDGHTVLRVTPMPRYYRMDSPHAPVAYDRDMPRNGRTQAVTDTHTIIITPERGSVPIYMYDGKLLISDRHFRAIECEIGHDDGFIGGDFGDYNTLWSQMDKMAQALTAWRRGEERYFDTGSGIQTMDKLGSYDFLLRTCGLDKTAADELLDELDGQKRRYWLKSAALLDFPDTREPTVGGEMSAYHQSLYPEELVEKDQSEDNRQVYEYESPFAGSDSGMDDRSTLDQIQAAIQTGDRTVFDATGLLSLIKSYNPTGLVDRFIPSITVGMDRIGRILFLIYWHYSEFAERYGEDEVGGLLDSLSSTFQQLGDLVVSLKKRTLAGDPEHFGLGVDSDLETDHA